MTNAGLSGIAAALVSALGLGLLEGGRPREVTESRVQSTSEGRIAQIALLFLRGTVRRDSPLEEDRYLVAPWMAPLGRDAALSALARIQKPVECFAKVRMGALAISCRSIADSRTRAVHRELTDKFVLSLEAGRRAASASTPGGDSVLLAGRGERLYASVRDLEEFASQYFLPYALAISEPDQAARAAGVFAVWQITSSSGWTADGSFGFMNGTDRIPE
jgi:hypothetical protein